VRNLAERSGKVKECSTRGQREHTGGQGQVFSMSDERVVRDARRKRGSAHEGRAKNKPHEMGQSGHPTRTSFFQPPLLVSSLYLLIPLSLVRLVVATLIVQRSYHLLHLLSPSQKHPCKRWRFTPNDEGIIATTASISEPSTFDNIRRDISSGSRLMALSAEALQR